MLPDNPEVWHRYAVQLLPTGEVMVFVDGGLFSHTRIDLNAMNTDSIRVVLFGASLDNEILHGEVRVYGGARWGL